jgi:hypothetical protein
MDYTLLKSKELDILHRKINIFVSDIYATIEWVSDQHAVITFESTDTLNLFIDFIENYIHSNIESFSIKNTSVDFYLLPESR